MYFEVRDLLLSSDMCISRKQSTHVTSTVPYGKKLPETVCYRQAKLKVKQTGNK